MKEACFCGRTGDVEDRLPVVDGDGRRALECPDCGHTDYLEWLPQESRSPILEEAERRREASANEGRPAA